LRKDHALPREKIPARVLNACVIWCHPREFFSAMSGMDAAATTLNTHAGGAMFSRILVPTDFSPPSDAALEYARILAATFGSTLRILHVIDDRAQRRSSSPTASPRPRKTSETGC
jgi:hypothetical protein